MERRRKRHISSEEKNVISCLTLRRKDRTQANQLPVIFILYVWLLLSTGSPRLEVIKIFTYPRNFPSIHLSFFLSLSLFEQIFFKYRYVALPRRAEGTSKGTILVGRLSIHPYARWCTITGRCKDREAKAFLDFPGRPPANLFPPYVDGELVPRWIFLSFYERGERKSKKKIDENENPLDLSSSWRWQLTCLLKW